jgi:predicted nucleotidyltransferase component of viral defense system
LIPKAYITEWHSKAPWQFDYQVEQDLIIERAIIEIFSDDFLREKLAFRGGTALHKLHLKPQVRYSEDIDLVQVDQENIGEILTRLRVALKFLGTPRFKNTIHNNTLTYRFETEVEPVVIQKLKIEINTREHFSIQALETTKHSVESSWFAGTAEITTFSIEELLATKLRALYQRRKGRDLFDFWYALSETEVNVDNIIPIFIEYLKREDLTVNAETLINSVDLKLENSEFVGDISAIITPTVEYDIHEAWKVIKSLFVNKF